MMYELIINHLSLSYWKSYCQLKNFRFFLAFELFLFITPFILLYLKFYIQNIFSQTKPSKVFSHYYINSFPDTDPSETDNEDVWNFWSEQSNMDYPHVNTNTLWLQLRQQKISTINFWNVLLDHSVNLIPFQSLYT